MSINNHNFSSFNNNNNINNYIDIDINNITGNVWLSWSSGKDAAYCLYLILNKYKNINVIKLLTTINSTYDRISLHGVRKQLLLQQIKSINQYIHNVKYNNNNNNTNDNTNTSNNNINTDTDSVTNTYIDLHICNIPDQCSHSDYDSIMYDTLKQQQLDNIEYIIFGDIHLEHVRNYRIERMLKSNIRPVFPIFTHQPTIESSLQLAYNIIQYISAILVCVDTSVMSSKYVGREYNKELIDELLKLNIDICGENGEFHTFVYNTIYFYQPIKYKLGNIHYNKQFCFIDILVDNDQ